MRRSADLWVVCGAAFVVVATAFVLAYVDLPWQSRLWAAVQDAGHVLAIGWVAVCLLVAARRLMPSEPRSVLRNYLLVLAAAAAIGLLVELAQQWSGRDAELGDFIRDVIGAAVFLAFAALLDPALRDRPRRYRRTTRVIVAGTATLLLVLALAELAQWCAAYVQRIQRFPEIVRFDSPWSTRFVSVGRHDLRFVTPPADWESPDSARVGRLTLKPSRYAGFTIDEPYPRWEGFDALVIELYSEATHAYPVTVRVHDAAHNQDYSDRFNARFTIKPGANRIRIPLTSIESAPRNRSMDMDDIAGIVVFASSPAAPLTLLVRSVGLE